MVSKCLAGCLVWSGLVAGLIRPAKRQAVIDKQMGKEGGSLRRADSLLVVATIDQQHVELGAQIGIHCGWCVCSCRPRYLEFSGWWSQGVL